MLSLRRMGAIVILLVGMTTALPVFAAETDPAAAYPYRYAAFDMKVAWNAVQSDTALVVSGLIKNVRYTQMEDIDLTISLLDKESRVVAVGGALPIPIELKSSDTASFSASLKGAVLRPGSLLQFIIRYRVHEGGNDDYTWMTSFTADAASGALLDR